MGDLYEYRFRDPAFLAIWERWQKARAAWGKAWESLDFSQGGPSSRFNPEPDKITSERHRPIAAEFIEARVAYLAFVDDLLKRDAAEVPSVCWS